ncbi:MAG: PilZ domain-containing protein [Planctomycetes bacterium]|nr:PilZ domain-containing protein [Planctomycetota bacterium]
MAYEKQESRYFTRVAVEINATITFANGNTMAGGAKDVSMVGMFLASQQHKDPGTKCTIQLHQGETPSNPEITIECKGQVARLTDDGFGIEFTHLIGEGTYNLLRQMVLSHGSFADAEKIVGELDDPHGVIQDDD